MSRQHLELTTQTTTQGMGWPGRKFIHLSSESPWVGIKLSLSCSLKIVGKILLLLWCCEILDVWLCIFSKTMWVVMQKNKKHNCVKIIYSKYASLFHSDAFLQVIKRSNQTPVEKFEFPQTEAQEIGWCTKPLVSFKSYWPLALFNNEKC